MSLFSGLYVGASGLKTSQNSLNTVAHNLSNINTEGYVRQQVATTDTYYYTNSYSQASGQAQVGQGVVYSECRHIRDTFLDARYREEAGREDFYEVSYSATLEIEDILGELDGASFSESLSDLWVAMEELSKAPSDSTYISLLVQNANSFVENARAVYDALVDYQDNLNEQIITAVEEINSIGSQISVLNNQIAIIESAGVENANDLRDQRDYLIDQLAEYGNITYSEDSIGKVSIRFNETDFVTDDGYYEMSLKYDQSTGFSTPYWKQLVVKVDDGTGNMVENYDSAYVFSMSEEISNEAGTDVGKLHSLLVARGDHNATFLDLDTSIETDLKRDSLHMDDSETFTEEDGLEYYNTFINNSIMMKAEAEFDNLVHYVVTTINEIIAENADPKSGYLCNDDGTPIQIFEKVGQDAYEKVSAADIVDGDTYVKIYDEDGNETGDVWRFIKESTDSFTSLYNCDNLQINQDLVQTPTILGFVEEDNSTDFPIGQTLIEAFSNKEFYINPNATAAVSIPDAYIEIVNQIATEGNVYKSLYEYQQLAVEQAEANRSSVVGVSSDEELEHMIMYQNAYNAASRYINVLNTLLDSVINMGA